MIDSLITVEFIEKFSSKNIEHRKQAEKELKNIMLQLSNNLSYNKIKDSKFSTNINKSSKLRSTTLFNKSLNFNKQEEDIYFNIINQIKKFSDVGKNFNVRKGSIISLSYLSSMFPLMNNISLLAIVDLLESYFHDNDTKLVVVAAESLYSIIRHYNTIIIDNFEIFYNCLITLTTNQDPEVRIISSNIDCLMKEKVNYFFEEENILNDSNNIIENEYLNNDINKYFLNKEDCLNKNKKFQLNEFIKIIYTKLRCTDISVKLLVVSWLSFINSLPNIKLINIYSEFLPMLFEMLNFNNNKKPNEKKKHYRKDITSNDIINNNYNSMKSNLIKKNIIDIKGNEDIFNNKINNKYIINEYKDFDIKQKKELFIEDKKQNSNILVQYNKNFNSILQTKNILYEKFNKSLIFIKELFIELKRDFETLKPEEELKLLDLLISYGSSCNIIIKIISFKWICVFLINYKDKIYSILNENSEEKYSNYTSQKHNNIIAHNNLFNCKYNLFNVNNNIGNDNLSNITSLNNYSNHTNYFNNNILGFDNKLKYNKLNNASNFNNQTSILNKNNKALINNNTKTCEYTNLKHNNDYNLSRNNCKIYKLKTSIIKKSLAKNNSIDTNIETKHKNLSRTHRISSNKILDKINCNKELFEKESDISDNTFNFSKSIENNSHKESISNSIMSNLEKYKNNLNSNKSCIDKLINVDDLNIPIDRLPLILDLVICNLNNNEKNEEGDISSLADKLNDLLNNIVYIYPELYNKKENVTLFENVLKKYYSTEDDIILQKVIFWINKLFTKFKLNTEINLENLIYELVSILNHSNDKIFDLLLNNICEIGGIREEYTEKILSLILNKFKENNNLLENKGLIIMQKLCFNLNIETLFLSLADILYYREKCYKFASKMISIMDIIIFNYKCFNSNSISVLNFNIDKIGFKNKSIINNLLMFNKNKDLYVDNTNKNSNSSINKSLQQSNKNLNSKSNKHSKKIKLKPDYFFSKVFKTWCINPVSSLFISLYSEFYDLSLLIVFELSQIKLNMEDYLQLALLVQQFESVNFVNLRIHLIEPSKYPSLLKTLYGIIYILPQGKAYTALSNRIRIVEYLFNIDEILKLNVKNNSINNIPSLFIDNSIYIKMFREARTRLYEDSI